MPNSRAFTEARSHLPTKEEIDGALSARYSERHRRRATEQALSAGFDRVPDDEPVSREAPSPPPPRALPHPNIDYPVQRFGLGDVPTWGPWLIGEIIENWPILARHNHASVIRNWISSNEHLFIRTSNSCALSIAVPHPFIGAETVVRGVFCWSRFTNEQDAELHLVQLHRFTAEWARSRRAVRFELFEKNDLIPTRADFFLNPKRVTVRYMESR